MDYAGKLMVMLFIVLGFVVILPQLEELYNAFQMQQRLHNSVNYTDSRKHVILCSSELKPCVLRDFLAEFFADPKNLVSSTYSRYSDAGGGEHLCGVCCDVCLCLL